MTYRYVKIILLTDNYLLYYCRGINDADRLLIVFNNLIELFTNVVSLSIYIVTMRTDNVLDGSLSQEHRSLRSTISVTTLSGPRSNASDGPLPQKITQK